MTIRITVRRLQILMALLVIGYDILVFTKLGDGISESGMLLLFALLVCFASYLWIQMAKARNQKLRVLRTRRDSLLKELWEEQHQREW
jgi:hypothetical protein